MGGASPDVHRRSGAELTRQTSMRSSRLKSVLKYFRASIFYRAGLWWLVRRRLIDGRVLVLMFHRVLDDPEFDTSSSQPELCVRASTFRDFLAWLGRHAELVDLRNGLPRWDKRDIKARVALTFDDGWLDNLRHAVPAAQQTGTPMTIFVCPGLMDRAFPFWPERVSYLLRRLADPSSVLSRLAPLNGPPHGNNLERIIEALKDMAAEDRSEWIRKLQEMAGVFDFPAVAEPLNRTMSWQDVREIRGRGVEIGSHTMTHPILTCLAADQVNPELLLSRREIEAGLGAPCALLAYPNGNHNAEIREIALRAGYTAAFTTEPGLWTPETDLFRVPRMNVFEQKLVGPNGKFSPAMATYYLFKRAFCSPSKPRETRLGPAASPVTIA
jgi:peptidoglycan/xylan/chitin deacetylase (PgdA/CDA1 family)